MSPTLKWLYRVAYGLDILTFCMWLLVSSFIAPILPAVLTGLLFFQHRKGARELRQSKRVSQRVIRLQVGLGLGIAVCFSVVIFGFASLDCLDVCMHPSNWWLISGVPSGLIALLVSGSLAILPYFLNKRV